VDAVILLSLSLYCLADIRIDQSMCI
jgi:hypothetical protein